MPNLRAEGNTELRRGHPAFVLGDLADRGVDAPLVRVHSECLMGDAFGAGHCRCGQLLDSAMRTIQRAGRGVAVCLRGGESRRLAPAHTSGGAEAIEAATDGEPPHDSCECGVGAEILADLGVTRMRLLSNSVARYGGLEGFALDIVDRVPLPLPTATGELTPIGATTAGGH